jgi:hypothetical protein
MNMGMMTRVTGVRAGWASGRIIFMREIRITLRGDDFLAVSEKLVAMGVTFHVEPVGAPEAGSKPQPSPRTGPSRKKAGRRSASEREPAATGGAAEAAARLRAMAERNRAAGARESDTAGDGSRQASDDET